VDDPSEKKGDPFLLAFGIYGAIGFQLASTVIGGLMFGGWLDKKWGTTPWLTVTGLAIGSIGGFYNLVRLLNWNQTRQDKKASTK
jgi:F0F1-type ATP synthase assembly protein I